MRKQPMKYVYLLGSVTVATYSFVKMLEERYNPSEHLVFIPFGEAVLKVRPEMAEFDNISYPPKGLLRTWLYELKLYYQAEHLILHGLFTGAKPLFPLLLLLLLFPGKMSKKLSWIEHGGDLYNWEYPHKNWKKPFIDWMNKKIRESASVLGVCHPMDERILREKFHTDAPCFYTQMRTMDDPFAVWESIRPPVLRTAGNHVPYRIQVGHNAFQLGNHIRILDMLEKFKDEDIQIVLPMAYGMTGVFGDVYGGYPYRNAVKRVGNGLFGRKSVLFFRSIDSKYYYRYLWNVDIVVLGLYRQAALGNLHPLLYMNKKIFLPSTSVMYIWLKEQGLEIFDTDEIPNMTFEEFVAPPSGKNREWVINFLTQNNRDLWDSYFDALDAAVSDY